MATKNQKTEKKDQGISQLWVFRCVLKIRQLLSIERSEQIEQDLRMIKEQTKQAMETAKKTKATLDGEDGWFRDEPNHQGDDDK